VTTDTQFQVKKFLPEGFETAPTNGLEALRQARQVLVDEGRWMTGDWFHNEHPEVDPEDPFCNSWAVCAEGAVAVVACGTVHTHNGWESASSVLDGGSCYLTPADDPWGGRLFRFPEQDSAIYKEALRYLRKAGELLTGSVRTAVHNYNDSDRIINTRTQVLAWFDVAIALATYAYDGGQRVDTWRVRRAEDAT
jgi:hypothetical protein